VKPHAGARKPAISRLLVPGLLFLLPLLLAGGCPDFRDSAVDAVDTATRDLIFSRQEPGEVAQTAADTLINAALDLFFDQFRSDQSRR
jgi:hypothetical protein